MNEITFAPSWKQHQALEILENKITEVLCFGGAAGGGKTYNGCFWKIKRRLQYPKTRGLIARETRTDLIDSTLITFKKVLNNVFKLEEGKDYKITFNPLLSCVFSNGSIELFKQLPYLPSDVDYHYLGSMEYTDVFLEEAAQIKEKAFEVVKSRIRWMLTEYNLIPKLLITCNPTQDWIYKEFYEPFKKGILESDRAFIQALVSDNPDPEFVKIYKNSLDKIKDPILRARLRDGEWDYTDDGKILFHQYNLINLAQNYHVGTIHEYKDRYITADTARYGKDTTVIYVWSGLSVIERVELHHSRDNDVNATNETVTCIKDLEQKYNIFRNNVIVDELGAGGGGVVDALRGCVAFAGSSSPIKTEENLFENYTNLKSQCVYKLSEYIKLNLMRFNINNPEIHQKIINEAKAHKKHNIDKDKLSITPKDEIKTFLGGKSPDDFDNWIMRMWFEIQSSYDPFAGL